MKIQYLGDSKDSFKWDYHDFLVDAFGYSSLNIVLMMTPDDGGSHGSSKASQYPARPEIIKFCQHIRKRRDLRDLLRIPEFTSSGYEVDVHSESYLPSGGARREYFSGIGSKGDQVVLIDPDNGLEPDKSFSEKHLLYSELEQILEQTNDQSVVSVFQHFRRKSFANDFVEISKRIHSGYVTAIYWHSLMFVLVTRSRDVYSRLMETNQIYASTRPVKVITND